MTENQQDLVYGVVSNVFWLAFGFIALSSIKGASNNPLYTDKLTDPAFFPLVSLIGVDYCPDICRF